MSTRRWVVIATVVTLAVVATAVIVVDRGSVAVFGIGPLNALRPSIGDLLDGRTANRERLEAIDQVTVGTSGLLTFQGMQTHGPQVYTMCDEGQNNWKVHDGYRLSCHAQSYRFVSWNGDFDQGRARILDSLRQRGCTPNDKYVTIEPRKPTSAYWEEQWPPLQCGGGTSLFLQWANGRLLEGSDDLYRIGETFQQDDIRNVTVPPADELIDKISEADWFVTVFTTKDFFRDNP